MTDEESRKMPDHPTRDATRLTDGAFYGNDPHPHLTWMRENAPVYWDEAGQVWGLTPYEDVFALSTDSNTRRSSGGIRHDNPPMPFMIDMDKPDHRKRRALVIKGFHAATRDGPRGAGERDQRRSPRARRRAASSTSSRTSTHGCRRS
jgi:cytochrome P450 family 142 subfamily A polypeptide 1